MFLLSESWKRQKFFENSDSCNDDGVCECKEKYVGAKCFGCIENHYGLNCLPCNCNVRGGKSSACSQNGKCDCKTGFGGRQCKHCIDGFFGPSCKSECLNLRAHMISNNTSTGWEI